MNLIKYIFQNSTVNIILSHRRLNAFLLRSRARKGCLLSALLFNIVLVVVVASVMRKEKEKEINKRHPDLKGRPKFVFSHK